MQNIVFAEAVVRRQQNNRRLVRNWLYFICLMVFAMVIVGGATRLTDSGLSITEWKPVSGILPPFTTEHWQEEFAKYQEIPEFKQINSDMNLSEFKFIYWWEWGHRFLGRMIGFAFALPLLYFWMSGRLESRLKPRLLVLLFLGGLQGFIGWWMVKSGLVDRVDVSQYRLAVHLTLACIIFAYAMWIARGLSEHSDERHEDWMPPWALLIAGLIIVQIFAGGLVAGMDAGLAYNTWPLMDGAIIPTGLSATEPLWLNWFENAKSVQFNHRMIAYALFVIVFIQSIRAFNSSSGDTHKRRTFVLSALVFAQMLLGIITLLLAVPMSWALLHQGGAVVLLGFAIAHLRAFRGTYPLENAVERRS